MSNQDHDRYLEFMMDNHVPVTLVLNGNLDVLYIHGEIDRYFRFPRAILKFNLNKMLEGELLILFREAVHKALKGGDNVLYFKGVRFDRQPNGDSVDLHFQPLQLSTDREPVVIAELHPVRESGVKENPTILDRNKILGEQIKQLEIQLQEARRLMQKIKDEQEETNEELQTSNRELMSSNEELQSTNEELQSVNEELYTVNSELQLKNEALAVANNDILNLLQSTEIGTIFLDTDLNVRRFTPSIRKHFNLLDTDVGRPISDFSSNLIDVDIYSICKEVFHSLEKFEQEVKDVNGNHYLLRILPYRTQDDMIQGLVITFVDVNDIIKVREDMTFLAEKFKAIFQNAEDVILELNSEGRIEQISKKVGPFSESFLKDRPIYELVAENDRSTLRNNIKKLVNSFTPTSLLLSVPSHSSKQAPHQYQARFIPVRRTKGTPDRVSIIVVLHDISSVLEEQKAFLQNVKEYQAFMDNARHQIALIDRDGVIKYINYTKHTGLQKKEMIGTRIYDYLTEDQIENVKESVENIFAGEPFDRIKFFFKDQFNNEDFFELIGTPVIIDKVIKYVALIGLAN